MRNSAIILSAVYVTLCCAGCTDRKTMFPFEDFKELTEIPVCENIFLGNPSRMQMIDSVLVIEDRHDGQIVSVINPESGECLRRINQGRGPGELMMVRRISYNSCDRSLSLLDNASLKISTYPADVPFSSLLEAGTEIRTVSLASSSAPFEVIPFGDGYVANGNFEDRYQFSLLDSTLNSTGYFGIYPGDNSDAGSGDAVMTNVRNTPETVHTYQYLYATDRYLYASYKGIPESGATGQEAATTWIMKCGWDGRFVAGYKVGNIFDFAVDADDEVLYTHKRDDSGYVLIKYTLLQKYFDKKNTLTVVL